jgi:hypothetical protein
MKMNTWSYPPSLYKASSLAVALTTSRQISASKYAVFARRVSISLGLALAVFPGISLAGDSTIPSAGDAIKPGDRLALKADAAIFHGMIDNTGKLFCAPAFTVFSIDKVEPGETTTDVQAADGSTIEASVTKHAKTGDTSTTIKGAKSVSQEKSDSKVYLHIKHVGSPATSAQIQKNDNKTDNKGNADQSATNSGYSGSGFWRFFWKGSVSNGQCDGVMLQSQGQDKLADAEPSTSDNQAVIVKPSNNSETSAPNDKGSNAAKIGASLTVKSEADTAKDRGKAAADNNTTQLVVANNQYTTTVTQLSHYGIYRQGLTWGALAIPYKYEFHDHSFQAKPSLAAYVGYESWLAGSSVAGVWAVGAGGSSQSAQSTTTTTGAGSSTTTSTNGGGTQALYTMGFGVLFTLGGSFKGGVLFGKDWAGSGSGFKYDGRTWMALTLGAGF